MPTFTPDGLLNAKMMYALSYIIQPTRNYCLPTALYVYIVTSNIWDGFVTTRQGKE